jgi:antitoxin ParD1/3/4
MAMASLNISLPQPLKKYVESQVSLGDYGTPSEYVRELIRRDKEIQLAKLEERLLRSLESDFVTLEAHELKERPLVALLQEKISARSKKKK